MMVKTRLWLAGEVRDPREMPRIRPRIERVRRGAASRPLWWCTEGLSSDVRARRETLREPVHTGAPGRPRRRPGRPLDIAPVVKRDVQGPVVDVERRLVDGNPRASRRSGVAGTVMG